MLPGGSARHLFLPIIYTVKQVQYVILRCQFLPFESRPSCGGSSAYSEMRLFECSRVQLPHIQRHFCDSRCYGAVDGYSCAALFGMLI